MINIFLRKLLRRKPFKGQFRVFLWLYYKKWLKEINTIAYPVNGAFKIHLNTKNFIDACIYYTGDYEPYLKYHFKAIINSGDVILDVGANIGFHTLYFAELTGVAGKVFAFEPVPVNFNSLQNNTNLNDFSQIVLVNKALGNVNEILDIHINEQNQNPGAYNLLETGIKNATVECIKGDDYIREHCIQTVNFIKVDVEGFELEVFKGLSNTILKFKPKIIFEYDANYQSKINEDSKELFYFLTDLGYTFFAIDGYGNKKAINLSENLLDSEILAYPNSTI